MYPCQYTCILPVIISAKCTSVISKKVPAPRRNAKASLKPRFIIWGL